MSPRSRSSPSAPSLADKLALPTDDQTPAQIAAEIIHTIRPDLLARLHQRAEFFDVIDHSKIARVDVSDAVPAPIRHKVLPPDLVGRIRLIRAALFAIDPHSMAYWLDGFQRDAFPTRNVAVFERIAAVYREYIMMERPATHEGNAAVYWTVRALDNGDEETARKLASNLPTGAFEKIRALFNSDLPVFDIADRLPFTEAQMRAAEASGPALPDKEYFPADLPEKLVRDYMHSRRGKAGAPRQARSKRRAKAAKSR
jgi:hypothetical protein